MLKFLALFGLGPIEEAPTPSVDRAALLTKINEIEASFDEQYGGPLDMAAVAETME